MLLNNRYRVLQTLGSGGFGDTFLAEDTQMPSLRRCVIKQLKPINDNPEVEQLVQTRFQREAAILEDLGDKCEQIPRLYAYFQDNGKYYLVQEWIEGDTLTARLQKQGVFSETEARNLLIDLLPILNMIHARGIIHRDIKPDNIILRYRDGKPVLIDFGAVRELMGTVVNSQGSPTSSIVIGTPGYMPSEQAMGRPVFVSDIYSLAITVIYLITGKQPQEFPTDPRTGELVWHNYAPYLSPQMRGILEKAIAYHPRDRFLSAQEMLSALKDNSPPISTSTYPTTANQPYPTQNTIPVTPVNPPVYPPSSPPSSPKITPNNNKTILVGGIIAAGLVGAASIISIALNNQPKPEPLVNQPPVDSLTPTESPTPSPVNQAPVNQPRVNRPTVNQLPVNQLPVNPPTQPEPPTPSPVEEPPVNETPVNEPPVNETPVVNQTPVNEPPVNETPVNEIPTNPVDFVRNYYSTINNGNLESAWNKLSPTFRNNRRIHPKGYDSYTDWWGGQVASVEIKQLREIGSSENAATVEANLNYRLRNGRQSPSDVRLYLVWDASDRRWIIRDAQRLRG